MTKREKLQVRPKIATKAQAILVEVMEEPEAEALDDTVESHMMVWAQMEILRRKSLLVEIKKKRKDVKKAATQEEVANTILILAQITSSRS